MDPTINEPPDQTKSSKEDLVKAQGERAAEAMRQKIAAIYAGEPNAKEEIQEAEEAGRHRSKHQRFMYQLSTSGKSLADIQTAWHTYYTNLTDPEKHQVWREFYEAHGHGSQYNQVPSAQPLHQVELPPQSQVSTLEPAMPKSSKPKSIADIKKQLNHRSQSHRKIKGKHHFQSLIFGLSMGSVVLLILLFGFFNERFIAPLISPSRNVSATPIITDPNSTAASNNPEVIIPKINVEIPVVYNQPSVAEKDVEKSLESGVVHYATTPNPGELGNAVIFGHSSNNILNKGKYKFAFVLLSRLDNGDLFYLDKDGVRYVYQVFDKKIVDPSDVSVLSNTTKPATATLITCDPPGTSLHRLIIVGQQISPDPSGNKASSVKSSDRPTVLPSNSPSLWSRLTSWL